MAEKKLTRQQLKEDPLVTKAFWIRQYVVENRQRFLWAIGLAVVLVLAVIWYWNSRREGEAEAETILTRANLELQTGQVPLALQDLRVVVEKHAGTSAQKEGLYYLGNTYFQLGDYDQAAHYYQEFLKRSGNLPVLTASAYAGLGTCMELNSKTKEAAEDFKKAVDAAHKNSQTPDYLVGAIRNFAALGDSAKVRAYFSQLKKDFPAYRDQLNQALLYMGINGVYEQPQ